VSHPPVTISCPDEPGTLTIKKPNSSVLRAIAEANDHTTNIKSTQQRNIADKLEKREHRAIIN
jgi:hypothetical protein